MDSCLAGWSEEGQGGEAAGAAGDLDGSGVRT